MDNPSREDLREWSANLKPDEPLDVAVPGETRYVQLAEAGRGAVDGLRRTIEMSYETTTQLLSGPSGAGKTTELYRLRRDLTEAGFDILVVDITGYISESSPLDITEFLIALAVGAHDVKFPPGTGTPSRPGFVTRLGSLLKRLNIDLDIGGAKANLSADRIEVGVPAATIGVNLGGELKSSRPFVDQLREKLSYHITQLRDEVADFLTELLPESGGMGSVLVVDGLEKLRGTAANDLEVQKSVESLFVHHAGKLKFRTHHLVYTVPTYLQFVSPGRLPYDGRMFVPVPHVHPRTEDDTAAARNVTELREVVEKRIPVGQILDHPELDTIIAASGGHLRDLFHILRELIGVIWQLSLTLPVSPEHVEGAIRTVARDYAVMTSEHAVFLRAVAAAGGHFQPSGDEVALMARMVQSQMLLGHINGEDWYEVHPLARRALGLP